MTEELVGRPPYTPEGATEAGDTLCTVCGWTFAMICPECPGCGCYSGECTGWRHGDAGYQSDDDEDRPAPCGEDCEGCGECATYGMAYGEVGW